MRTRPFLETITCLACLGLAALVLPVTQGQAEEWALGAAPLMTPWAKDVSPQKVWPEYPRPQMVRKDWVNLNGLWDYAIRSHQDPAPAKYDGSLLVPFPLESALS